MNRFSALIGTLLFLAACSPETATNANQPPATSAPASADATFFDVGHAIIGDGSPIIDDAVFIVSGGKVTQIGKKGEFPPPKGAGRTDLKDQVGPSATVMPGLINVNAYPGLSSGPSFGEKNYKHDSVVADLSRYEYYGVFAVASGGLDVGDVPFAIREELQQGKVQGATYYTPGRGITAKGGYPADVLKGVPLEVSSEADARKAVTDLAAKKVDFIKIFVNGSPKLSPTLYHAIIDEAKKANLRVFADAPALADAKDLVNSGVSVLVNSVTDASVDDQFVAAMKEKNVFYAPGLTALEARYVYADKPDWLGEQFMREVYPPQLSAYLADAVTVNKFKRNSALASLRQQYSTAQKNLKKLADGGVKIALGTGSGLQDTYPGYFEHRELGLMVDAGMTPADAIKAATAGSAEALGLSDLGTLAPGKTGDLIVTANNPFDKISETKTVAQIYVKGARIEQGALIKDIKIDTDTLKITKEDRAQDAAAQAKADEQRRIDAMPKYGPWPLGKSVTVGGLSIPTPYGSSASTQAGPPIKIAVNNMRGSAGDWRSFYGATLKAWKPAGNCWERQHPINNKTMSLCVEPGASSAAITIAEK